MSNSIPRSSVDYGFGHLLWLCVVLVLCITINGGIVDLLMSTWTLDRPFWLEDPRVLTAIGKIAPFLMLVGEYWVFDFFADRIRRWRTGSPPEIA